MKRKNHALSLTLALLLACAGCGTAAGAGSSLESNAVQIVLSDSGVTVDGASASTDPAAAVYTGADIVYYRSGQGEGYGAGTEADAHDEAEAAAHTVVTITQPGLYRISGALSRGQLAVDLGEEADADPEAVVTLLLDGVDITCTVAPAVLFYSVYECGSADAESASPTVDTSAAGANVILADGSVNHISGSYVAKIYKEGTDKKLHKYDGAFYSKMSMNISGEQAGTGILNITAENEGLDAELHLTIQGGNINITAGNDGINTNEDGVSVTTVNGGTLTISAGLGEEGDGIDSNGYLVINGGSVVTVANGQSGDGGLDADGGVYLNGGEVIALGSRNDSAEKDSAQPFMELSFATTLPEGSRLTVADSSGALLFDYTADRTFSSVILSSEALAYGETYAVCVDGEPQQYTGLGAMGGPGGMGGASRPEGQPPARPEGAEPRGFTPPETDGTPSGESRPGEGRGGRPDGMREGTSLETLEGSTAFTPTADSHSFSGVSSANAASLS